MLNQPGTNGNKNGMNRRNYSLNETEDSNYLMLLKFIKKQSVSAIFNFFLISRNSFSFKGPIAILSAVHVTGIF